MSKVYRLSKVEICRREVKSESGEGKKNTRRLPRGKSCADNISCKFKY